MKWYRGSDGRQRLWLEPLEHEDLMEDELRRARLAPTPDRPIVDLEVLIEQHLHATLDQYALLEQDVLGCTAFTPGRPPHIMISRALTGAAIDEDETPQGALGR